MKYISYFIFRICLVFLISHFVFFEHAHAQTTGLSIAPPTVEIILAPNKKVIQAFTIHNQGESGEFVANIHSVTPVGTEGHVTVSPRPIDPSSIPLIYRLENADLELGEPFRLGAGDSRQLVISLEGASTDVVTDTYLSLVVSAQAQVISNQTPSAIATPGIGSLILVTLTPEGTLPVNLEVEGFDLPTVHDSIKALAISPILANQGPVMLRVAGDYTITSTEGKIVTQIPIYNNLILKESKRIIQGVNGEGEPIKLSWQPSFSDIGLHTVRLTIKTVGGTTIQEVERSVWVAPVRTAISILIAVTVISLLIFLRWRRQLRAIDNAR